MKDLTRRDFLKVTTSAAGGLAIGFSLPAMAGSVPFRSSTSAAEINTWIVIEPDNSVILRLAKAELGQGVMTSMAMLIAEELEVEFEMIRVEYADVSRNILNPDRYGSMRTAYSSSIADNHIIVKMAGAEARERLVKAAAETWVVSPADCYADFGAVYRKTSRDSLTFGEVAALASSVSVANVKVKTPDEYDLMGLSMPRLDTPHKVDGTAIYSIDVRLPDMVYAAIVHCPVSGGTLRGSRFNAIRRMPGVLKDVRLDNAVAVIAETFWQAKTAIDAMPVFWDIDEASQTAYSNTIKESFFDEFSTPGEVLMEEGDIINLMDAAERTIESDYFVPYLAQAPMEPLNCTVHVQESRVDVWVGHQDPEAVVAAVAKVSGKPDFDVHVHNCYVGGSFGRRRHTDFVEEATRIAMTIDRPVQMIWAREEEFRAGRHRPMAALRFKAGFDVDKQLLAMTNHAVVHSIAFDEGGSEDVVDPESIEGLIDHPYILPGYEFSHTRKNTFMTSGHWRSGGHSINAFALECFLDEMANAAGSEPVAYRRVLLGDQPDYLRVLDELVQSTDWYSRRLPRGQAMGMAIHKLRGTICAMVAEVGVQGGEAQVNKISVVIDCGHVVNPKLAEQQVESAIMYGLTATLYGKLTIEKGRVLEDNLDTYQSVLLAEAPEIDIKWSLSQGERWGGLGEPATALVAPAVCNALFKITGRRIRSLPVRDYYLQAR